MLECDVLVVGAGPAGASAAYFCARGGLNTILIEKNANIGDHTSVKIDSSPNINLDEIIRKYGLPVKNRVKISKWYAPSGKNFTLKSDSGEFYFKRGNHGDSYENIVSKMAIENGTKILTGINLIDVIEKENFEKVIVKSTTNELIIKPKLIVAADGGSSFFHKFVKKEDFKILAGYGISGYDFTSPDCSSIYLNSELLPGGYFYVVSCPDGLSSAGAVVDASKLKGDVKEYFKKFVESTDNLSELLEKKCVASFRGFGYIFKMEKRFYKNLIFIGDAGGFMDPLLGYGMAPAILSSYLAYEVIKEGLEENMPVHSFVSEYDKKIKEYLNYDRYYQYREIFEQMENKDFEWLIDFINRLNRKIDLSRFIEGTFI